MNEEAMLLVTLWEAIQDYIPAAEKVTVAESTIKTLMEFGNDIHLLHDAEGTCPYLDKALLAIAEEEEEEVMPLDEDDGY